MEEVLQMCFRRLLFAGIENRLALVHDLLSYNSLFIGQLY